MTIKKSSIRYIYICIAFIFIYFSSDSIYGIYYDRLTQLKLLVSIISILPLPFLGNLVKLRHISYILLFITFFSINCLNNDSNFDVWGTMLFRMIALYPLVLLCKKDDKSPLEFFAEITYKISIIFLIIFLVILLFGNQIPYQIVQPSENLFPYQFFLDAILQLPKQDIIFDLNLYRLHAFTWEAGQYQIYLNFALYYYLFFKSTEKKRIVLLIVSIVATFSTMGLLILCVQILIKVLFVKKYKFFLLIKIILGFLILFFGFLVLQEKMTTGSYDVRTLDMVNSLNIIKNNFIHGIGVRGFETSNGLLSAVADNGLIIVLLLILGALRWINSTKNMIGLFEASLFILIFILSLMNEPIQYTSFIFLIVWIMFLDNSNKKSREIKNEKFNNFIAIV